MTTRTVYEEIMAFIRRSEIDPSVVLRVCIGWVFLSSGIAKLAENGFAYSYASKYLRDAVPIVTPDFVFSFPEVIQIPGLVLVKAGALIVEPLMQFLASMPFIGSMVVVTELIIGFSLIFGAFTNLGSLIGAFMMLLFYYGNAEWSHGLLNSDMVYLILLISLIAMNSGEKASLDSYFKKKYEIKNKALRKILGL